MQVAYQDTKKIKKSTPQRGGGVEVKKPYGYENGTHTRVFSPFNAST